MESKRDRKLDKLNNISRSDLHFYKKVMSKYQKGKKNLLYLPVMIFRKNMSYVLSQIINAKFKLQLHFLNQSLLFSLITKNIQGMKALFRVKRPILQFLHEPDLLRNFKSGHNTFQMQYEASSVLLKFLSYDAYVKNTTSHLRWIKNGDLSKQNETPWEYYSVLEHKSSAIVSKSDITLANTTHIKKPQIWRTWLSDKTLKAGQFSSYQKNIKEFHSLLELKLSLILSKSNISLTNKIPLHTNRYLFNNIYQNAGAFINRVNRYKHEVYVSNFAPLPKGHFLKETDSFYFRENRKIEQAIELVKKIAEEARETVTKKSVPGYSSGEKDIGRQIDINRISDQVYKMIDHKFKIEKERRGYL
jgi:hypothetical protein